MNIQNFCEIFGEIREDYVLEARKPTQKAFFQNWRIWVATAACLCLVVSGTVFYLGSGTQVPSPDYVQVTNPILEVESLEEMEEYLDFTVPELDKPVDSYVVLVVDGYPEMGRIYYSDGSVFNVKYGTGDISGIYGGTLEKTETIADAEVSIYSFEDTRYGIWEKDGYTYSLTGPDLEENIALLME